MENFTELEDSLALLLGYYETAFRACELVTENQKKIEKNNLVYPTDHASYNDKKSKFQRYKEIILNQRDPIEQFNQELEKFVSRLEDYETRFVVDGNRYDVDKESHLIKEYIQPFYSNPKQDIAESRVIEKISIDGILLYLSTPSKGLKKVN